MAASLLRTDVPGAAQMLPHPVSLVSLTAAETNWPTSAPRQDQGLYGSLAPLRDTPVMCPSCTVDQLSLACRACDNNMNPKDFCNLCVEMGLNDAGCRKCP